MSTESPELDTQPHETPEPTRTQHPEIADAAVTWVRLAGLAAVANIVVLAVALIAGADMQADFGSMSFQVNWLVVIIATAAWLAFAVAGWALVAHRAPALAHLWVPLHWGMAVVAGGALVAVSGSVATAVTLVVMDVVANAVAAHLLPRRLPR